MPASSKRVRLFKAQNGKCYYCDVAMSLRGDAGARECTVDHKLPLSRGGLKIVANECGACFDCNNIKADRTEAEFLEFMQTEEYRAIAEASQGKRAAAKAKRRAVVQKAAGYPDHIKQASPRPPADLTRIFHSSVEDVFADVLAAHRARLQD